MWLWVVNSIVNPSQRLLNPKLSPFPFGHQSLGHIFCNLLRQYNVSKEPEDTVRQETNHNSKRLATKGVPVFVFIVVVLVGVDYLLGHDRLIRNHVCYFCHKLQAKVFYKQTKKTRQATDPYTFVLSFGAKFDFYWPMKI